MEFLYTVGTFPSNQYVYLILVVPVFQLNFWSTIHYDVSVISTESNATTIGCLYEEPAKIF